MAVRSIALVVALGACGRLGFDASPRDLTGDAAGDGLDAPADAAPPCGPFGTVKVERPITGVLIDVDRISITPTTILVATNIMGMNALFTFDHDLGPLSGPTPIEPVSNMGINYDPTTGSIFGHQSASPSSLITKFTLAGNLVAGPVDTGSRHGSGFVDPQGHLHLPISNGPGFREYDGTLSFIGTWGMTATDGLDGAYDPTTGLAWHVSGNSTITPFDLSQENRPPGTTFAISFPSGIQIDARGTVYVLSRPTKQIYAVRPGPTVVDMITYTEDPVALKYDPVTDRLLLGFYTPPVIRQLCPYLP